MTWHLALDEAESSPGDKESEFIMATADRTPEQENIPAESREVEVETTVPMDSKVQRAKPAGADKLPATKLGRIWTATIFGLLVLILLIIFIAQNQEQVTLNYFAYQGQVNLGLALFFAAIGGALVVAIAGVARVIQLRSTAKKQRKANKR
ncbi:putative integral membrane protein [Arthrobacter sp. JUb119]|uniref:LapA family protein n=2 Tax=Actinomycetota TaxID=201174 RepID=UPI002A2FAACD|nr:putative integral membrane protein [Arthrobacter sp. JUb119]